MYEQAATSSADLELVARIEAHCVRAWPAAITETTEDGWVLRATPGLDRGRSNHALTPPWPVDAAALEPALARVAAFADRHGIHCGLQVSPIDAHVQMLDVLATSGWKVQDAVLVLSADTAAVGSVASYLKLEVEDHASPEWLAAWAACEPERAAGGRGRDIKSHVDTVFPRMAGLAKFVRNGDRAVAIAVEDEGVVGLFCIAVAPRARRQGLGKALVRGILAGCSASTTYLQVFSDNMSGLALYRSLGFQEAYRYCHCLAPVVVGSD